MTVISTILNLIHSGKENSEAPKAEVREESESYTDEFDIDDAVLNY